jgi:hypothetical protein
MPSTGSSHSSRPHGSSVCYRPRSTSEWPGPLTTRPLCHSATLPRSSCGGHQHCERRFWCGQGEHGQSAGEALVWFGGLAGSRLPAESGTREAMGDAAASSKSDTAPEKRSHGIETSRAENPLWWPQTATTPFNPRTFGGKTLPKSSKLPKAGTAIQYGPQSLYDFATLTSTAAAVRSHAFSRPSV